MKLPEKSKQTAETGNKAVVSYWDIELPVIPTSEQNNM